MNSDAALQRQFNRCMPFFIALGDPVRLKIISSLNMAGSSGLNVSAITKHTNLSRPAVSHHLKILKESGLINLHKKGTANYYYLTIAESTSQLMHLGNMLQDSFGNTPDMDFNADNE